MTSTTADAPTEAPRRRALPLVPLLLLLFALGDLRVEFQLLADRFTFTSLLSAIHHHGLAVLVLVCQPSLWRHYRRVTPDGSRRRPSGPSRREPTPPG